MIISMLIILGGIVFLLFSPIARKPVIEQTGKDKAMVAVGFVIILLGLVLTGYTITFLF